jgi:hypothetical protein
MAIVSDVEIRLRADIARLQQDMTRARQSVSSFTSDTKKLLGGFAAAFSLKAVVSELITAQREFDKLNSSLVTATGSSASAAKAFGALQAFAASTPYSVAEATEAFIKLRNLGLTPSERALGSYGNTAAAMGKGLNQMIEAVADAATGEFERLKEFGIKAKQNGDKVMFTFQGVTKSIGNNAKDIEAYLMKIGETDFAGAMERRANKLDGALSNLGDTWQSVERSFNSNGFGEGVMSVVLALSGALTDLAAIIDTVGGAASKEGEKIKEASGLHTVLTETFKGIAAVAVLVAAGIKEVGEEIGALAALAQAVGKGDWAGAKAIIAAREADMASLKTATEAKINAIGKADKVAAAAREKEAAEIAKNGTDRLAGFAKEISAEEKKNQALLAIVDITNKLNGVDKDTVGNLAKLKTALDTGAISQADYAKYTAQIKKETTEASTAYKNQVKALDLSSDAIKRRAAAQAFANQQEAERVAFLNRTGQMNDADAIAKKGALELDTLEQSRKALAAQLVLEKQHIDNKQKIADLNGQIAAADKAIDAKKLRNDEAIFEQEQKSYREAITHKADLIEAAQQESLTQQQATRDLQDEIDALGLTGMQLAEVTAARLRDRAAALDRRAEIGIIEDVNDALRAQAEELRKQADLGLTRERVQEQQKFWGTIEQTAHDTFVSIGDGGADMWKRLRDTGKNLFFEWLYQMTLKKWIINVGASFDGASATAGIANSMGGSTSVAGSLGNLYSSLSGGMTAAGSLGSGFMGSVAGGLNGAGVGSGLTSAAGLQIGNSIASVVGPEIAGALSSGLGALAAAAPYAAAAAAIYYVGKKAFGMGPKEFSGNSTLSGWISGNGSLDANNYADWTKQGGWLRSDQHGSDRLPVDPQMAAALVSTYQNIKDSTAQYAKALGLNADDIANRAQDLTIQFTKDDAANQKAIADFFSGVADNVAREVLPSMDLFMRAGETAGQTMQRLAVNATGVDQILAMLGTTTEKVFGTVSNVSILARERLLELAGGLDALATQTSYYYQNFLTEGDRVALMQKPLHDALAALGFAGLTTTEDFKAAVDGLVSSGKVATEEGAKQYAGLLALAPQFKTVADYLKGVSDAAAQTAKDLADAKAALVDSNRSTLSGIADGALSALGRAVEAEKARVDAALQDTLGKLDTSIASVNDTIARTGDLSKALKGAITAPGLDNGARADVGRAEISAALAIAKASGILPTADSLANALSAVTQDSSDGFSSAADYQRAVARTNSELEALGGLTDGQLNTAQMQLQVLQDQKAAAQAAHDTELARLDGILASAQAELDAINGVATGVLAVVDAVRAVRVALDALKGAPTSASDAAPAGITTVEDLYRKVLGRDGDAAGIAFWKKAFGDAVDQSEYLDFVKGAQAELQGMLSPPVVESTTSGSMSGSSAMLSELQTLNARMATVEVAMNNTATATGQFAQQFNQVSGGGNALATEAI